VLDAPLEVVDLEVDEAGQHERAICAIPRLDRDDPIALDQHGSGPNAVDRIDDRSCQLLGHRSILSERRRLR
jgi:hypothetical protein